MAASSSGTSITTCQSKRRHTPHDIFSFKYIERALLLRSISRAHGGLTFRAKCIGLDQFETNPLVPGTITHYCCICLNDKACISHTTAQVNITCLFAVPIQTRKRRKTLCCIVWTLWFFNCLILYIENYWRRKHNFAVWNTGSNYIYMQTLE
jgi:hypothetical protein